MTLDEIKSNVLSGNRVFWVNTSYEVIQDKHGEWIINHVLCPIGLTWSDGKTMNGKENEFFIG